MDGRGRQQWLEPVRAWSAVAWAGDVEGEGGRAKGALRHFVSSRGDLGELPRRIGTLELQTGDIQHTLEGYVMQKQEWQQNFDAQLSNLNNMMQQQQADWKAYFHHQGFNPYHGL
uniref:Uncharacterized protein n=1 Tax=Oryza punctata TaxID=4537 RepID=A0A0E0M669_ORYPU